MIKITTLQNGLRIVTESLPGKRLADLCLLVQVGSRHEKVEGGVAHAVEHCVFNGTANRGKEKITGEIEKRGGMVNAETSIESTNYTALVLKEDFCDALDILADMVQNPSFDKKDLAKEKKIICQEIKECADDPESVLAEATIKAAFDGQPITHLTGGRLAQVRQMTPEKLRAFVDEHYTAANMIVSASGDIEHEAFVQKCEKAFENIKSGEAVKTVPAVYEGSFEAVGRVLEQLKVEIAFKGYSYRDENRYACQMVADILGDGFSSRLVNEVREKRGLAYDIHTWTDSFCDTGLFSVKVSSSPKQMREAIPVICEEILKFSHTLTEEELQQAQRQYISGVLINHEKMTNHAAVNAEKLFERGIINPVEKTLKAIKAVTKEDVIRVADEIFASKPTFAAVGLTRGLISYDTLCRYLGYRENKTPNPTCVIKGAAGHGNRAAACRRNGHMRN